MVTPRHRRGVAAAGTAMLISLILFVPTALSQPYGIGEAKEGCTCHGGPDGSVSAVLEGLPADGYEPEKEYPLVVKAVGGVPVETPPQSNLGGFALHATGGALLSVDDTTHVVPSLDQSRNDLVHTEKGNDRRTWNASWKSPRRGEVTFYLSVNTVNGNAGGGGGTTGDKWAQSEFKVKAVGGESSSAPPLPSLDLGGLDPGLLASFGVAGIALILISYALVSIFREKSGLKEIDESEIRVEKKRRR